MNKAERLWSSRDGVLAWLYGLRVDGATIAQVEPAAFMAATSWSDIEVTRAELNDAIEWLNDEGYADGTGTMQGIVLREFREHVKALRDTLWEQYLAPIGERLAQDMPPRADDRGLGSAPRRRGAYDVGAGALVVHERYRHGLAELQLVVRSACRGSVRPSTYGETAGQACTTTTAHREARKVVGQVGNRASDAAA